MNDLTWYERYKAQKAEILVSDDVSVQFNNFIFNETVFLNEYQKDFGDPSNYRCQKCGGNCGDSQCGHTTTHDFLQLVQETRKSIT